MTSPVTKITDYVQRTQDDLLGQFWDSPVIKALAEVLAIEYQRFEDVAYDMLTKRLLDNAVGVILDRIGKIARVNRLGRTDDEFRAIIQVAIAARDSDGGAEQIIWIASQLVGESVRYIQEGKAYFELHYTTEVALSDALLDEALDLIGRAPSAGVGWRLIYIDTSSGGTFDVDTFGAAEFGRVVGGEVGE
jgi:hypothetical protein